MGRQKHSGYKHMNIRNQQILVVDNDEDVRSSVVRDLEACGYEAVTTWSGVEALNLLRSIKFAVLLTGEYLPDMYIGRFLAEVSRLPIQPTVFIMQVKPTQDVCSYESQYFRVITKGQAAEVVRKLGTIRHDCN